MFDKINGLIIAGLILFHQDHKQATVDQQLVILLRQRLMQRVIQSEVKPNDRPCKSEKYSPKFYFNIQDTCVIVITELKVQQYEALVILHQ